MYERGVEFGDLSLRLLVFRECLLVGIRYDESVRTVHYYRVAALEALRDILEADDRRYLERFRHDRRMGCLAADIGRERDNALLVERSRVRRRKVICDDYHFFIDIGKRFAFLPQKVKQDPLAYIADVGNAFPEIFVLDVLERAYIFFKDVVENIFDAEELFL